MNTNIFSILFKLIFGLLLLLLILLFLPIVILFILILLLTGRTGKVRRFVWVNGRPQTGTTSPQEESPTEPESSNGDTIDAEVIHAETVKNNRTVIGSSKD